LLIGTGASMNRDCRVVISGIGIVAPNGIGLDAFWRSLLAGESGIDRITGFDASQFPISIAGEVKNFNLADFFENGMRPHRLARHTQLALAATKLALEDAGLTREMLLRHAPLPVVMGVSNGAVDMIERGKASLIHRGPSRVSPHTVGGCQPHAIAVALVELLGVGASMMTVSSACAAGLDAVAQAYEMIRSGRTDMVITGGADSATNELTVASFHAAGMVPSLNGEDPRKVSRPFDRCRKGGIMAEGAGIVILERLDNVLARGGHPWLEIHGYGTSVDAGNDEPAAGLEVSMRRAMTNAMLPAGEIDYICAHGPSDPVIDRVETDVIRKVMGRRAYQIPVTSIKGSTGNPLSAAGPHELATCALIVRDGVVPPTTNYEYADPECDLDYVAEGPRRMDVGTALLNLHGLGGGNSSMIVSRVETS
jgi:3-oxoacyl-[acyl-carrier-protein] synthase II